MISTIAAIALGGAVGAVLRHSVNIGAVHMFGHGFPWGTMIVNIAGSFLMGVIIVKLSHMDSTSQAFRAFCTTGLMGAFTTFSTFSLDFTVMWERGEGVNAISYALASVILAILALFAGLWAMRSLSS